MGIYSTLQLMKDGIKNVIYPNSTKAIKAKFHQPLLLSIVETLWDKSDKLKTNAADSTEEYLEDKVTAGADITVSVVDTAGVKSLNIASTASDELVKTNASDSTAGYLEDKVVAGEGVSVITSVGDGSIEVGLTVSTDLAIYVVDGNNTQEGVGSPTNPFWTIDRVVERILGEDGSPVPTGRPTIVVRAYEGANYTTTRNLWLDCNWVFEIGAVIQATSMEAGCTYLFDQDHSVATRGASLNVVPDVYGQGSFMLTGVSFYKSSDTSAFTPSGGTVDFELQFALVDVTTGHGVTLGSTGYSGISTYHRYNISGQNGASQGELIIRTGAYFALQALASGTRSPVWSVFNVLFNDRTGGTPTNALIELNNTTYVSRFEGVTIASGGTKRATQIAVKGSCLSLQVNNFVFTKGGTSVTNLVVFAIETASGNFDNYITNAVVSYENAPFSTTARFIKHTSGSYNNEFLLHNIVSNIDIDGYPSDFSDLEVEGLNVFGNKAYAGDLVLNKKTTTIASTATLNIDSDTIRQATVTAQAEALTIANPTGAPIAGQRIVIKVGDNGTTRTVTLGGLFRNTTAGPMFSGTTVNKIHRLEVEYNSVGPFWDIVQIDIQS